MSPAPHCPDRHGAQSCQGLGRGRRFGSCERLGTPAGAAADTHITRRELAVAFPAPASRRGDTVAFLNATRPDNGAAVLQGTIAVRHLNTSCQFVERGERLRRGLHGRAQDLTSFFAGNLPYALCRNRKLHLGLYFSSACSFRHCRPQYTPSTPDLLIPIVFSPVSVSALPFVFPDSFSGQLNKSSADFEHLTSAGLIFPKKVREPLNLSNILDGRATGKCRYLLADPAHCIGLVRFGLHYGGQKGFKPMEIRMVGGDT